MSPYRVAAKQTPEKVECKNCSHFQTGATGAGLCNPGNKFLPLAYAFEVNLYHDCPLFNLPAPVARARSRDYFKKRNRAAALLRAERDWPKWCLRLWKMIFGE